MNFYNSYGSRKTAEAVADLLKDKGYVTQIKEDHLGNHQVWREEKQAIISNIEQTNESVTQNMKIKIGKFLYPLRLVKVGGRLELHFKYNAELIAEIKAMEGAKYHGFDEKNPRKIWSIKDSPRNQFQLAYLSGKNPYAKYDAQLIDFVPNRPSLYEHQKEMAAHVISRKECYIAGEMGVGKSLALIEAMEYASANEGITEFWWVAPKSALYSVQLEFEKWDTKIRPKFYTYETLKKLAAAKEFPQFIVFDEGHQLKTPTSQRSQAAVEIATMMRAKYINPYIVVMTGSPSPRTPTDWYHQCITGDTWIFTKEGPRQICDLENDLNVSVHVDSKTFRSNTGSFSKGRQQVYQVLTKEGFSFKGTEDHKVLVERLGINFWVPIKDLYIGETVIINEHKNFEWNGIGDFNDGYILGLLIGDGCVDSCPSTKSGLRSRLIFFPDDYCLISKVQSMFDYKLKYHQEGDSIVIDSRLIDSVREKYDLGPSKEINTLIQSGSSDFLKGLISALFDTDGSVRKKATCIRLGQSNLKFLQTVQRLLVYFGIYGRIRRYPNQKLTTTIKGITYNKKPIAEIEITGQSAEIFFNRIGFLNDRKYRILKNCIERNKKTRKLNAAKFIATVEKVTKLSIEKVYDISIPDVNCFSGNGFTLHNCEVACPGFLREGTIQKFQQRLAIMKKEDSLAGGQFWKIVSWKDSPDKCNECGDPKESFYHDIGNGGHSFVPCKNEVSNLYERMKGLVLVKLKSECLSLPEKVYRIIKLKPSMEIQRAASLIIAKSPSAIQALTLLRELSDGFQYKEVETDFTERCPVCKGTKVVDHWFNENDPEGFISDRMIQTGRMISYDESGEEVIGEEIKIIKTQKDCPECLGLGEVPKIARVAQQIPCPKEDALTELLEEHDDVGRMVTYGGFTGSVDRIISVVSKNNWDYIRADGRGWLTSLKTFKAGVSGSIITDPKEMLRIFQSNDGRKIDFIGQAGAAGQGLTLTASPSIVYYSNSFNGVDRIQSEDRIHRPGCRGANIIDLIHLNTDQIVLDNIKKKRKLQALTLNDIKVQEY